jgi:RNA polymerase sigma factor (sigma-70 family)
MKPEAIEQTLRAHGPLLARIAASHEANAALRQELLQEITLACWQALPRWREQAGLKTFLARVAQNCAVDHVVRQTRNGRSEALDDNHPDPVASPEQQTEQAQQHSRLRTAVQRLPLNYRVVVTLALEGFSHAEIGDAVGLTPNNVDVRMCRARALLRAQLEQKP